MNKQRFTKVLKIPGNLKDDLPDLQELQRIYPYAQAIHVLVALAHKQNNTNDAVNALNYAAMYVADRHNLKELVTTKKSIKAEPEETVSSGNIIVQEETGAIKQPGIQPEPKETDKASPDTINEEALNSRTGGKKNIPTEVPDEKEHSGTAKAVVTEIGHKFRESLLQKLEKLQNAKRKWKSSLSSEEEGSKNALVEKIAHTVKEKSEKKAEKKDKKKKNESADKETTIVDSSPEVTEEAPVMVPEKGESIEVSEKEVSEDVDPDKIKKQQELISKFIEISPSIKAKANKPPIISADQEDLSVPSTSFKDNLISENLADIMVSQGKDDKAIDIYKKLIWKFPQKKAYFASRIEELTKKKG